MEITKTFNRRRFIVDIETDDEAYLEQTPVETSEAAEALISEIRSNLESLDGIRCVVIEPTG
jgi:hypothetical protein